MPESDDLFFLVSRVVGLVYLPIWLLLLFDAASKRRVGWFVATLFLPILGPAYYFWEMRHDRERRRLGQQARARRTRVKERADERQREELSELRREVTELRRGARS